MGGIIEFPTYWNVESGPDEARGYYANTAAEAMVQFIESHVLDQPRYEFGVWSSDPVQDPNLEYDISLCVGMTDLFC